MKLVKIDSQVRDKILKGAINLTNEKVKYKIFDSMWWDYHNKTATIITTTFRNVESDLQYGRNFN